MGNVGNVHGAAVAAAIARFLLEEFGDHALHVRAPGNAVAMAAMGGGNIVAFLEGSTDAGRDAFLAEIGVEVATDQALAVELDAFGFEDADLVSGSEKFFQQLAGWSVGAFG